MRARSWPRLPFTPKGVASWADAPTGRVILLMAAASLVVSAAVAFLAQKVLFPAIEEAIQHLPDQGRIELGQLSLESAKSGALSENPWVSLVLDLDEPSSITRTADLQVRLQKNGWLACSLAGCVAWPYPAAALPMNNRECEPWWGAWAPILLAGLFLGTALISATLIGLSAAFHAVPANLLVWILRRRAGFVGLWRIAVAASIPSILLVSISLAAYALGILDLIQLLSACLIQLPIFWGLGLAALAGLPRRQPDVAQAENPFAPPEPEPGPDPQPDESKNPFAPRG